jgi:surfactin synthase thioesterase subunit
MAVSAFQPAGPVTGGRPALFCLPYAGGAANCYAALTPLLAPAADVWTAELPGRGTRFGEPPARDLDALATELAAEVAELGAGRAVLFGHSMGATIAFAAALELTALGAAPSAVILSGQPAPRADARAQLHTLADAELTAAIRRLGGTSANVLAAEELWGLMLEVIRADLALVEPYRFAPDAVLDCPLTAYASAGDEDAHAAAVAGWAQWTTGPFETREFDGGHFHFQDRPAVFAADLARRVCAPRAAAWGYGG